MALCCMPLLLNNYLQADEIESCPIVKMNQINYFQLFSIEKTRSVTELYQKQMGTLERFATQHNLQRFKVLSKDINVASTSYIPNLLEVNLSVTFESEYDETLLDKVNTEFSPQNFSFSVVEIQKCHTSS